MNKLNILLLAIFSASIVLLPLNSCEKEDEEGCGETNISYSGESESHNKGQNCMNCHRDGGGGEGCFNAAGTVYDTTMLNSVGSGKVEFFTLPDGQGELKHTIQIDAKGNFFTTENVVFEGLYPVVTGPSGVKNYMGTPLTSGACNSCHGVSTDRIKAY
jgi:hypothetical protein